MKSILIVSPFSSLIHPPFIAIWPRNPDLVRLPTTSQWPTKRPLFLFLYYWILSSVLHYWLSLSWNLNSHPSFPTLCWSPLPAVSFQPLSSHSPLLPLLLFLWNSLPLGCQLTRSGLPGHLMPGCVLNPWASEAGNPMGILKMNRCKLNSSSPLTLSPNLPLLWYALFWSTVNAETVCVVVWSSKLFWLQTVLGLNPR